MVNYTPKTVKETAKIPDETIKDLVIRKFSFLTPDNPIDEAINYILQSSLNGMPVLNENRGPVGYLSEKDCLKIAYDSRYHNSETGKVADHMYHECHTLCESTNLFKAVEEFTRVWYHAYPVTEASGSQVIGMIFRKDLLTHIVRHPVTTWFNK